MTMIKAVRFCQIEDDEWVHFTDGQRHLSPFGICLNVRDIRKHVDMSIPVFHVKPFYHTCESTEYRWLFTISTKDYEDLLVRKDWF